MKRKRTKKKVEPGKQSFAGMRVFKHLSFGYGSGLVDALRRVQAEKLLERQQKAAGKPN